MKSSKGLSHKEAQAAYRGMSERLGHSPSKADLTRHPRIASQVAKAAQAGIAPPSKAEARKIARLAAENARKRSEASQKGWETRRQREALKRAETGRLNGGAGGTAQTSIKTLAQWNALDWEAWDYEYEECHVGDEYEYTE